MPRLPKDFPYESGGELNLSWANETIRLDEAHRYSDVYPVVGSLCAWWAGRNGNDTLADEWKVWMEGCAENTP